MALLLNQCRAFSRPLRSVLNMPRRTLTKLMDDDFNLEFLEGEHEGIAVCSFTRPQAKNALSINMCKQLEASLDILKFEDNIRVTIIRSGAPGVFCAGADLKERVKMKPSEVGPFVAKARKISMDIHDLPMPTICALDGIAVGGGLEFALCCDMRTAASEAKMGLVETRLAIIPGGGGTQRLARLVGPAIAKELIFTSKLIDGDEALKLGVVNHAVPQNEAGDAAYMKALEVAHLIRPNGPIALRMAKQSVNRGIEVDLSTALSIEQACYAQVIPTKDRLEGLMAFKEKRVPVYKGE